MPRPILRILGLSLLVFAVLMGLAIATTRHGAVPQQSASPAGSVQARPSASPEPSASPQPSASPPGVGQRHLRQLTRYPYLTDVVADDDGTHATINWATDRSDRAAFATYGVAGTETSTAHVVTARAIGFQLRGVPEYQWRAEIRGLRPGVTYAYRVFLGADHALDLLGSRPLTFTTPPAPGSSAPFSFAVMGDWGATDGAGKNRGQARLDAQIAASPASFILSTGDTAYPSGSQTNYGDLYQKAAGVSAVFGPSFYKRIGSRLPMFVVPGNHGGNSTMLDIWPETTATRLSAGRYQMDSYRISSSEELDSPSVWYAFTVGATRFYMLTAAWGDLDVRHGTLYSNDYLAHWRSSSSEYRWLRHDLATHPSALKVAVFHFPVYSDNRTEASDPYLRRPGGLASLLTRYKVNLVFNGHAHIYERNRRRPGESFVSYVTGTGGGRLESVGKGSAFDAYAIGWNSIAHKGTAAGSATPPTSPNQVYSFLLVTVSGREVTVRPINALGQAFDVMTYRF